MSPESVSPQPSGDLLCSVFQQLIPGTPGQKKGTPGLPRPDTPKMKGQAPNSTARLLPEPGHDGLEGCE